MVGPRHVGNQEILASVAVKISDVCAHRKPRCVRSHFFDDITERPIAVVFVEAVGILEIIADIDVRQPVVVEIPPGRGVATIPSRNPCSLANIGEFSAAVIAKQVVFATGIDVGPLPATTILHLVEFLIARQQLEAVFGFHHRVLLRTTSVAFEIARQQETIEIPIEIVVTE